MELSFKDRNTFYICGYFVETCLETCDNDLSKLWNEFQTKKEALSARLDSKEGFYGLMWYTENHRYCYLLGMETDSLTTPTIGMCCKCIPQTHYAITEVPHNMSVVEAWTEYFAKTLPNAGYKPNAEHGMYFEYYPSNDTLNCQLWTPVILLNKI